MDLLRRTPTLFAILAALIEEHAGLHYGPDDADVLVERVSVRAVERGFESLLDYYYFLRYDEGGKRELDALVETLAVNETYLFREARPLVALIESYLAPAIERAGRARVWSAAAATGDEPLTLAMLLAERDLLSRVDILATDLSEKVLAQARRGELGRRSLRNQAPGCERWLRRDGERVTVDPQLVAAIRWSRFNLMDAPPASFGSFDGILLRNVLIYFSQATTAAVVQRLASRLAPGGALLVGVSESLLSLGTALRCEERSGVFFYESEGASWLPHRSAY